MDEAELHIIKLRILTNFAMKKKEKLFTFIDSSYAYDLVSRHLTMIILKHLGCGMVMLVFLAPLIVTQSSERKGYSLG